MIKAIAKISFVLTLLVLILYACKKEVTVIEPDLPKNPFDELLSGGNGAEDDDIDSSTIVGIHKYILSPRCALSGCHDGAFEPDYRTIQSSYSTLVYHPIVKNNTAQEFTYRVIPFDTAGSLFHERITNCCFVNVGDRMPQDGTTGNLLPQESIDAIAEWIMNGARDIFGNVPELANPQPTPYGMLVYLNDTNGIRLDTVRPQELYPFEVPKDSIIDIWVGAYDEETPLNELTYRKINFSTSINDFSVANEVALDFVTSPHIAPAFNNQQVPYFFHYQLNSSAYNLNDIVYFRIYFKDEHHENPTEIPSDGSQLFLKTYFSFQIK